MLALLAASLLLTAVIVRKTHTAQNSVSQTAHILEENLHKKESFTYSLFDTKPKFGHV
jgi:two-component system nitrogen regulation sensor histidine kinase NtrY